jgi:hypothetical protein
VKNTPKFSDCFEYFTIGTKGYIIWNNHISESIKPFLVKTFGDEYPVIGELLAGDINEKGYYLIQYDGERKTKLIMNNQIFDLGNEIDTILDNSIHFEINKIVFYAICKNKIKRFEISD